MTRDLVSLAFLSLALSITAGCDDASTRAHLNEPESLESRSAETERVLDEQAVFFAEEGLGDENE